MNTIETLKAVQEKLGLNQRELGVYAGVSTRTMNAWCTGYRECPEHVAELIARLAYMDAKALEEGQPTSTMRRWCIRSSYGIDEFLTPAGSKADALRLAKMEWEHMTEKEKANAETFEVCLVDIRLTDRTIDGCFGWADSGEVYDIAKDYLK